VKHGRRPCRLGSGCLLRVEELDEEEQIIWLIFRAADRDRQIVAGLDGAWKAQRSSTGVEAAAGFYGYRASGRLVEPIEMLEEMEQAIEKKEREHARKMAEEEAALKRGGTARRTRG
jgi:hypothetical protein